MEIKDYAFHYPIHIKYKRFICDSSSSLLCRRRSSEIEDKLIATWDNLHISTLKYNMDTRIYCRKYRRGGKRRGRREKSDGGIKKDESFVLGPTPGERTGHYGWRDGEGGIEDEQYWKEFRGREVAYRVGTFATDEDLIPPKQPLDRDGKKPLFPAAVHYDEEVDDWVPTSKEKEDFLRAPFPVKDPFFVPLAKEGEQHTSLNVDVKNEDEERETYTYGGLEYDTEMIVKDMTHHRRKPLGIGHGAWKVVHLGTSSAVPTPKRNVSGTAIVMKREWNGDEADMFIVDAGENTDDQLIKCDWCMTHGFRWIRAIFITHLHGDHIFGLPMLLANIGKYAQHRKRKAVENNDESDPVIRVFGPYGTRGFVRASLYWTNPVGVRFSVAELVPRKADFRHIRANNMEGAGEIYLHEDPNEEPVLVDDIDVNRDSPPPHPDEVRTEDVHAGDDGLWHVWKQEGEDTLIEVVAAPLKHRMPCFGYVFRESALKSKAQGASDQNSTVVSAGNGTHHGSKGSRGGSKVLPDVFEIDKDKAKELGVHGTQLRVLRSGRSITVSKTGLIVKPEDVAIKRVEHQESENGTDDVAEQRSFSKKVTVLGDTCDSSAIESAAMDSDLLLHEATFMNRLKSKAAVSMHSTASMAGAFAKQIRAKKTALYHFSSRYELFHAEYVNSGTQESDDVNEEEFPEENDDLVSPNQLVQEAIRGHGGNNSNIIAAYDFLCHDIDSSVDEHSQSGASSSLQISTVVDS